MQLQTGGWVRQQNSELFDQMGDYEWFLTSTVVQQMPLATGKMLAMFAPPTMYSPRVQAMAGVNMRLEAGAIRELHWHQTAEARMLLFYAA